MSHAHSYPTGAAILIVDDEPAQREVLAGYLKKQRHTVWEAASAAEALARVKQEMVDIVLTDLKMPDRSGLELLKEIRALNPEITVVIMTAFGTIENAVAAMREGAYDYLSKPIDLEELDLLIQRIGERRRLISENRLLKAQLAEKFKFTGIVSQSAAMEEVLNLAGRVAESTATVLIRGESGTGKELIAKAIHFSSPRKDKPFIAVNCAALNENLLESELFGHERGAFTGADKQRRGRFELADGGTIFLDEIGDVPLATQVKLLRVLQEHQFERVGGTQTIQVDVRVIAATNRNLEEKIKEGTFREDLFYRLNVVSIEIPPLRQRREDIAPAIEYFLQKYATANKKKSLSLSKEAMDVLLRYDYPGNMRELQNLIERAVVLSRGEVITTADLPLPVRNLISEQTATPPQPATLPERVEALEKEMILEALQRAGGNQSQAAKALGISERNLRYRLQKWGMK
ncbi:MAG: sigma-54 dependent transcriptional regulator [candidate division KSB1 bacterium]|nr:sigma-54 dependent transcriptional regulator [candidate division KSB1 bacterium]MDZ7302619.1 sigma-54 dependent transcriptional regulator [candidate division KSB1 bacterium]MDZ7311541.1 sigma-54 dependent transcriptional regulator [candidate division KSB1 bacterium]